jgi:hypothetical protein
MAVYELSEVLKVTHSLHDITPFLYDQDLREMYSVAAICKIRRTQSEQLSCISDKGPSKPCSLIHTSIHNDFVCRYNDEMPTAASKTTKRRGPVRKAKLWNTSRPQRQEYLLTSHIIFLNKKLDFLQPRDK